jgi:hypothetical protein
MAEKDRDDESIFKVDTIPPPAGDDDAYSAPTRVGPSNAVEWAELMRKADESGRKSAEADAGVESARPRTISGAPEAPEEHRLPSIDDEDDVPPARPPAPPIAAPPAAPPAPAPSARPSAGASFAFPPLPVNAPRSPSITGSPWFVPAIVFCVVFVVGLGVYFLR